MTPQVGDIYQRKGGKLYRLISICENPSMTLEEVEGTQPSHFQGLNQPLTVKERVSGVIGSSIFNDFVRLVPENGKG